MESTRDTKRGILLHQEIGKSCTCSSPISNSHALPVIVQAFTTKERVKKCEIFQQCSGKLFDDFKYMYNKTNLANVSIE